MISGQRSYPYPKFNVGTICLENFNIVNGNRFQTLAEAESPNELWENVKKIINDAANKHIPRAK